MLDDEIEISRVRRNGKMADQMDRLAGCEESAKRDIGRLRSGIVAVISAVDEVDGKVEFALRDATGAAGDTQVDQVTGGARAEGCGGDTPIVKALVFAKMEDAAGRDI